MLKDNKFDYDNEFDESGIVCFDESGAPFCAPVGAGLVPSESSP